MTKRIIISTVIVLFAGLVQAEETYNITSCYSGDVTVLSASDDMVILGYDLKGVSRKNETSEAFHNWSFHLIGTTKIESRKNSSFYYGKWLSPEGDLVICQGERNGDAGTWKFIYGTGKWKGIAGGGTNEVVSIKPVMQGTTQGCSIARGTYKLPQ